MKCQHEMLQLSSCPGMVGTNTIGLSQEYKRSNSEIGILPWKQHFPHCFG
jgi:hypothetical protein